MHVENLDLNFDGATSYYHFPCNLLGDEGQLRLKHLSLTYCLLNPSDDFNGFSSLTSLALEKVILPDNFTKLISCSPSLQKLSIQNCKGLINLKIGCPPRHLKYLKVVNSGERLEIYAQNLVRLECSNFREALLYSYIDDNENFDALSPGMVYPHCILTPDPCFGAFKYLKVLAVQYVNFTAEPLKYLLANCHVLEQLTLEHCDMPSNAFTLEISQLINLESLNISKCRSLKKILVSSTNLKKFVFISMNVECCPGDTFELLDDDGNRFSSTIGKGSSLKHLDLGGSIVSIDLPHFSSLETVTLREMRLEDENIMDLLSNCLLLRSLSIIKCRGFLSLHIVGPFLQLKQLTISRCNDLKEIEICALNLTELEYHGAMLIFSFREVPQLVSVEMEIEADDDTTMMHILSVLSRDVPNLETLIFYIEDGKVPDDLPTFYSLKHLVLFLGQYPNSMRDYSWAAIFLVASPLLEKYQLQLSRYLVDIKSETTTPPWTWTHHHLKEVELGRFSGSSMEIELAANLIQNSKALELMRIDGRAKHRQLMGKGWYTASPPFKWVQSGRQIARQEMSKIAMPGIRLEIL